MGNRKHETQITIDANPFNSKALVIGLLKEGDLHQVVELCMDEIVQGVQLNVLDIPFYVAALDILSTSLKSRLDEQDQKMYNKIMKHSDVCTIHGDRIHTHDDNGEEEDE